MVCLKNYFGDGLLFSTFQYYSIVVLYILGFVSIKHFDNPYFTIWLISLVPFLDEFLPMDLRNPTKEESKMLETDLRFKLPLYTALFVDWFFTIFILNYVSANKELSLFKFVGCFILGLSAAGINIVISHELMHKNNKLDEFLGMVTLSKNLYMHFFIEHVHGHHKNVATPRDPATARYGQTLYEFIPQTIIGSLKSAWHLEANRMLEIKKFKSVWVPQNRMLCFGINNIILPFIVYKIWGFNAFVFYVGTTVGGILQLEMINYIEHYGLLRKEISSGVYEKVNISHSWNAQHRISNYFLLKLQRHSDHHENGYKPYQILSSFEESPQLPHGYLVCILIATVPSLWFKIMNEIVVNYNLKKEISNEMRAMIHREIIRFIVLVFLISFCLMFLGFSN